MDEQGEHQGCGEPAEAGTFSRGLADDGDKREDGGAVQTTVGIVVMNRMMPATVPLKRWFFPAVLYGAGHADRERPAQEQGGDGQQERAYNHGQMPNSWGIRRQTQLNIWPPCALNTTGSAKQAMRAGRRRTRKPRPAMPPAEGVRHVP